VVAGVLYDLGRRVEAHRLGVEQGRAEYLGMMAFQPGRRVSDLGEARRVAFRKAVAAKAFDLLERPLGEVAIIAVADHPVDELVAKRTDSAGELEGRHRPPKGIGLARGEAGTNDRDLHRLFLEQRHALGLLEHFAKRL
jgi:hypothetical protein